MIQYIFTLGAWVKNGNLPPICTRDYSGIESALVEGDIIGKYIYIYTYIAKNTICGWVMVGLKTVYHIYNKITIE